MLWSKSFVQADSLCPKQSVKLRMGDEGRPWDGFKVGSHVHYVIAATLKRKGAKLNKIAASFASKLSIQEMVSVNQMLRNFEEMGVEIPDNAVIEQSYYSVIEEGGEASEWKEAPTWMERDSDWDPSLAKETMWRFQPDAYFLTPDGKKVVCVDWKTGWSSPSDSALMSDIQAITYCAALCQMTGAEEAEFRWWNLRWKNGQAVSRPSAEGIALAKPIWEACWTKDRFRESEIAKDQRPGEHCGRCSYADECLVVVPEYLKKDDKDLYLYSRGIDQLAKKVRSEMKDRLKQRTGTLEIGGGVTLGPKMSKYKKWKRGEKEQGMKKVMESMPDGVPITDIFDVKGSVGSWFDGLPDDLKSYIEQHIEETSRQVLVEKEN